ncbi:MAG: ABC transporter ATP-binding protein [Sulfolobales archaeon]|nr:ABC transporter ATP-binding protein [Sulfolobales archaeon]
MDGTVVRIFNLRKSFGRVEALRGISFEVARGEIFGVVGPNGAGKTTLLRIVAGLMKPSSGEVEVLGHKVPSEVDRIRKYVSYLPEEANLYSKLSGIENLKLYAMAYVEREKIDEVVRVGISIAGLDLRDLERRVEAYSKGMSRRVAVAATLMVKPRLAILDEPTAGLDVVSARYVREVIRRFTREFGTTVILSSHNMFEVSRVCDRVALIHSGRVVAVDGVDRILSSVGAEDLEEAFVKIVGGRGG